MIQNEKAIKREHLEMGKKKLLKIKNEQAENFETQNKGWGIKLKKSFRKHNKEKKKRVGKERKRRSPAKAGNCSCQ